MRQFAGCSRFLWNKAFALQKGRLDDKQSCLSYNKLANMLPASKKEHPFLADAPSQTLQQTRYPNRHILPSRQWESI